MRQQFIRNVHSSLAEGGDGTLEYRVFHRMIAVTTRLRPEARCCWFS